MANRKPDRESIPGSELGRALAACALALLMTVLTTQLHAQTLTVLHQFTGHDDGARPGAVMTMDRAGNFYGSTAYGGDWSCNNASFGGGGTPPGCGVLFKLKKAASGWVLNPLYIFPGSLQDYLPNYPGGLAIGSHGPGLSVRPLVLQCPLRLHGKPRPRGRRKSFAVRPAGFRPGGKHLWNDRLGRPLQRRHGL